MGGEGKSHRKKKAGRKAEKRKAAEGKKKAGSGGGISNEQASAASNIGRARHVHALCGTGCYQENSSTLGPTLQARKQNPKAFVFASRGKAKLQRSRTAEKEQRRMHGVCVRLLLRTARRACVLWYGRSGTTCWLPDAAHDLQFP